eukprot:PhM_4_TR18697/c0_g1_i1/m.98744/K13755/PDE1; calcium/calmodulin-dependent 3',5'-cyclic nucleotide phosphodiesterase
MIMKPHSPRNDVLSNASEASQRVLSRSLRSQFRTHGDQLPCEVRFLYQNILRSTRDGAHPPQQPQQPDAFEALGSDALNSSVRSSKPPQSPLVVPSGGGGGGGVRPAFESLNNTPPQRPPQQRNIHNNKNTNNNSQSQVSPVTSDGEYSDVLGFQQPVEQQPDSIVDRNGSRVSATIMSSHHSSSDAMQSIGDQPAHSSTMLSVASTTPSRSKQQHQQHHMMPQDQTEAKYYNHLVFSHKTPISWTTIAFVWALVLSDIVVNIVAWSLQEDRQVWDALSDDSEVRFTLFISRCFVRLLSFISTLLFSKSMFSFPLLCCDIMVGVGSLVIAGYTYLDVYDLHPAQYLLICRGIVICVTRHLQLRAQRCVVDWHISTEFGTPFEKILVLLSVHQQMNSQALIEHITELLTSNENIYKDSAEDDLQKLMAVDDEVAEFLEQTFSRGRRASQPEQFTISPVTLLDTSNEKIETGVIPMTNASVVSTSSSGSTPRQQSVSSSALMGTSQLSAAPNTPLIAVPSPSSRPTTPRAAALSARRGSVGSQGNTVLGAGAVAGSHRRRRFESFHHLFGEMRANSRNSRQGSKANTEDVDNNNNNNELDELTDQHKMSVGTDDEDHVRSDSLAIRTGAVPDDYLSSDRVARYRRHTIVNRDCVLSNVIRVPTVHLPVQRLADLDSWHFDVFSKADLPGGPLYHVVMNVFYRCGVPEDVVDPVRMTNLASILHSGYSETPYHNAFHAADVVQTVYSLLSTCFVWECLLPLERFSVLIAAAFHDFGHPGRNNNYLINTHDDVAIEFNDRSVLENFHCRALFEVCRAVSACDIMSMMDMEQYRTFRRYVCQMILATDMADHFTMLDTFRKKKLNPDSALSSEDNKLLLLKNVLHTADVSNPAKPKPVALEWSRRVMEEFAAQGQDELMRGIVYSPFCDPGASVVRCQSGFIQFAVKPSFEALAEFSEDFQENLIYLNAMVAHWHQQAQQQQQQQS